MSLVAYDSSGESEGSEDEAHEKRLGGNAGLLSGLPPPKSRVKPATAIDGVVKPKQVIQTGFPGMKQTTKISIPDLPQVDSDDDDDKPSSKKPKISSFKTGLMALLPQPKQSGTKETNRLLIPHTLTKKPAEVKDKRPAVLAANKRTSLPASDMPSSSGVVYSDDEEEDVKGIGNFFSLDDGDNKQKPSDVSLKQTILSNEDSFSAKTVPESHRTEFGLVNSDPSQTQQVTSKIINAPMDNTLKQWNTSRTQDTPVASESSVMDAPLQFKNSRKETGSYTTPSQSSGYDQNVSRWSEYDSVQYGYSTSYPNYTEQSQDYQSEHSAGNQEDVNQEDVNQEDVNQYLQDEQFLRIQGKKQRGKEEISFIDVNAADQMSTEIQLTKGLTEEDNQWKPQRSKKGEGPSSQQKRKHQITYLAHQAKEREFDLKNQWSQNSLTKKQTQAKYGF